MAGLQLSGLASGLDWQSLVDKLIAAERAPETKLRATQALAAQKSSALGNLSTQLTALSNSIKALSGDSGNAFADRKATFADAASTWSAAASTDADTGSYQVQVTQLATKAQWVGASNVGSNLSATADVSGLTVGTLPIGTTIKAGDFTINGTRITVAATDSLADVFALIQTKTGVTASYDPATDKVGLSSASPIVLGSANDTSNFLGALKLYNNGTGEVISPKALGVVSVGTAIQNANLSTPITGVDAGGNGTFSINGVSINYNVNSDSVQNIIARINSSDAGVTAGIDRLNDRFTLTNKTEGDIGISVSEGAGGLLEALGLKGTAALSRGKNAEFNVDGGPTLISTSNNLDGTSHGIAGLSITANSLATQTVNVGPDTAGARTKIEDFIAKYNAVQAYIEQQSKSSTSADGKVTASTLAGNREVSGIASSLRSSVFDAVPGLSGTITRLEGIGIDFKSGSSQLEIKDSTKLNTALSTQAADVRTLFSSQPGGLVARLTSFIQNVTGTTGTIAAQTATFTSQSKSIDTQIAAMERRLASERTRLQTGFIAMETAQSRIQSQLAALNNAFGISSSSTSK